MAARVVLVDCAAPIPVGHRVEVRVLKEAERGFFSRRTGSKHQLDQPWVRDLDTGIEYGVLWQYSDDTMVSGDPGASWSLTRRADLEEVEVYEGKVKSCSVITLGSVGGDWRLQTRLELE